MYGNVGTIYHREINEGLSDKVTGTWKKTGSGPGFKRQRIAQEEEVASARGLEWEKARYVCKAHRILVWLERSWVGLKEVVEEQGTDRRLGHGSSDRGRKVRSCRAMRITAKSLNFSLQWNGKPLANFEWRTDMEWWTLKESPWKLCRKESVGQPRWIQAKVRKQLQGSCQEMWVLDEQIGGGRWEVHW